MGTNPISSGKTKGPIQKKFTHIEINAVCNGFIVRTQFSHGALVGSDDRGMYVFTTAADLGKWVSENVALHSEVQ